MYVLISSTWTINSPIFKTMKSSQLPIILPMWNKLHYTYVRKFEHALLACMLVYCATIYIYSCARIHRGFDWLSIFIRNAWIDGELYTSATDTRTRFETSRHNLADTHTHKYTTRTCIKWNDEILKEQRKSGQTLQKMWQRDLWLHQGGEGK